MIERIDVALPHGITLSCRVAGAPDAPLLVFLHGFPEGAFVWDELLLHYYRASPLRPPTADDDGVLKVAFAPEFVTVPVPTLVIWGEDDRALPVALLDGLEAYLPRGRIVRVPGATHWIVHERGPWIAQQIEAELATSRT